MYCEIFLQTEISSWSTDTTLLLHMHKLKYLRMHGKIIYLFISTQLLPPTFSYVENGRVFFNVCQYKQWNLHSASVMEKAASIVTLAC